MTEMITTGPSILQDDLGHSPLSPTCRLPDPCPIGAAAVGQALTRHLLTDPRCRRLWQSRATRGYPGRINQAAVAEVLAEYLWDSGQAPDSDTRLPRRLKDRVSRALAGQYIAPQTLRMFIEAFNLAPELSDELWDLLNAY